MASSHGLRRPPHSGSGWLGAPLRRREDWRLLTGRGRFVDDLAPAGALHLCFARAVSAGSYPSDAELNAASLQPGVRLVLGARDIAGLDQLGVNPLLADLALPDQPLIATPREAGSSGIDAWPPAGQIVAAVVADSAEAARDAAETIAARQALVASSARAPGQGTAETAGPEVFRARWSGGKRRRTAPTAVEVTVTVQHARLAPMALEPRAALAMPDPAAGTLTLLLPLQTPSRARDDLARILGLEPADVRVIAPDVGGAFGGKASLTPEDVLVALAALRLGRAVRWCATRSEEFLAAPQGRGGEMSGTLAVSRNGRCLALSADGQFPLGAWLPFSAVVPARNAARILPGPYRIGQVAVTVSGRQGSTAPVGIYRGAGRPEAAMLMERLMDEAAAALGLDPVTIRRRNVVKSEACPWRTPTGETIDSADYPALLDRIEAEADLPSLRRSIRRRRRKGEVVGWGIGLYVEPAGLGWESARLTLTPDGRFVLATGSTAQGQGRETAFAQIVADALGVTPDEVVVHHGDTANTPPGIGALASRSTAIGGSAALLAARKLLAAAGLPETAAPGTDWAALAARTGPLGVDAVFETSGEAWSSGGALAVMRIDHDTGVPTVERLMLIDDAGTVVNPLLVEGQLHGGGAQGLGEALMERLVQADDGQLLTGSLMDYAVPRAADIPPLTLASQHTPSPLNPLGAKGVGEAGAIGVPAAIVNAAVDALRPFGVKHLDMPLTSQTLWRAMRADAAGEHGP